MTMIRKMMLRVAGPAAIALGALGVMAVPASAGYLNGCTDPGVNLIASSGTAQGYGSMYCASNVSSMELEVDLYELWTSDGKWHFMPPARTLGPYSVGNGRYVNTDTPASVPCKDSSKREWRVYATGYADIGGVWYAGQNSMTQTLDCRA